MQANLFFGLTLVWASARSWLPVLPVILPLFTASLIAAFSRLLSQRAALALSLIAAFFTASANLSLARISLSNPIVYWFGGWSAHNGKTLSILCAIDPVRSRLAALTTILSFAYLLFSVGYF